jgi:hypothetical protein
MIPMDITKAIKGFDQFLAQKDLSFEAIVIGGAALRLMGVISRNTDDCDILYPKISMKIKDASVEFAQMQKNDGHRLLDKWFNNGPERLAETLPDGWMERKVEIFKGSAIVLYTLDRLDLLRSKLFSLCDRDADFEDCIALNPSEDEVSQIIDWIKSQDGNPMWPEHVESVLGKLMEKLKSDL